MLQVTLLNSSGVYSLLAPTATTSQRHPSLTHDIMEIPNFLYVYSTVCGEQDRCTSSMNSTCATDLDARRRLRSSSLPSLIVRRRRLSTVGDRSFPVGLFHIMSRPHRLWLYSEVVWRLISSVALFHDFLNHIFIVFVQWPFVISDTLIVLFTYLVTYLLSYENDKIARVRLPVYFVIVLRVVVPGRSWSSLERNRRVVNCWLSLIVSSH